MYPAGMRTTLSLDPDVAAEVARLRREEGVGLSEAVNQLARAGLSRNPGEVPFRQQTYPMGARVDLANVAEVLELLDEG